MNLHLRRLLLLCLLLPHMYLQAQQASDVKPSPPPDFHFRSTGGIVGFGKSVNTDTRYQPIYLLGDYSRSFKKQPRNRDFVAWYFEPQLVFVRTPKPLDIEFGANLGIRNYIRVNNGFFLYQMLGSGPHYISADVRRQANGFIFSDNLAAGSFVHVGGAMFLNLQFRIRHLSNAELKQPNGGINMWNVLVGLSALP
jgi:hypothetical protein